MEIEVKEVAAGFWEITARFDGEPDVRFEVEAEDESEAKEEANIALRQAEAMTS